MQREFLVAIEQVQKQTVVQRLDELQAQQRDGGLGDAEKRELLALLQMRAGLQRAQ